MSKTTDERKPFEEEKELLLREFKVLANLFVVCGYLDNDLDLYMELFQLAKDNQIDDEFRLIDACSFFVENCLDFKQKFSKENLNLIIEKC